MADYTFQYANGTTGSTPYMTDPSGNPIYNAQGGVQEGLYVNNAQGAQNINVAAGAAQGLGVPQGWNSAPSAPQFGQAAGGAMGGTAGGGYGIPSSLSAMQDSLVNQATGAFNRNVLPGIRNSSAATGGLGGSRQGVIEANAMNDLGNNITNGLASLNSNAYGQGLNYDIGLRNNQLGYTQAGNNYDLGLKSNQFQNDTLDNQINNDNIQHQLQGAQLGLNSYNTLQAGNAQGIAAGTTLQNNPLNYYNQFSNTANSIGQGYANTSQSNSGGGSNWLTGALGGAQLGSLWANQGSTSPVLQNSTPYASTGTNYNQLGYTP